MLWLIDKLVIAFIYINILIPRVTLSGVPLNKAFFLLLFLISLVYIIVSRGVLRRSTYFYLLTSYVLVAILSGVSLMMGNSFQNIANIVSAVFVLLLIPVFSVLFDRFAVERYLRHILIGVTLLGIYIVSLYLYFSQFATWNPVAYLLNETTALSTVIAYRESGPQIIVRMVGWLPVGLLLSYYKAKTNRRWVFWLSFGIIGLSMYFTRMAGIVLSGVFSLVLYYLLNSKVKPYKILFLCGSLAVLVVSAIWALPEDILDLKKDSLGQKGEQTYQALEIFSENVFWGKGLGYVYQSTEFPSVSGEENLILEVTYPMVLASTGLVGTLAYFFIWCYYPIKCASQKNRTNIQSLLLVAYMSVLVSAIGNPIMWSGGLGMFMLCMLAAVTEKQYKPEEIL